MSKTVKLDDQVYDRLEQFRDKRETFSEAVGRLLDLPQGIFELANIVGGQLAYREHRIKQLEETAATHR